MYIPSHFANDDPAALESFIAKYGFGTLITIGEEGLVANHLPFLYRPHEGAHGSLVAHLARANPQSNQLADQTALVVFVGPHGYISPSYYESAPAVPTWNYQALHIQGACSLLSPDELRALLDDTVARQESSLAAPWRIESLPADYRERLENEIVGFRLRITRMERKDKLGQNRSDADRHAAAARLRERGDVALANVMEATFDHLKRTPLR